MLDLPKSTAFNRRIAKQKFYDNLEIPPGVKRSFTEQIKTIWWRNKIAPATMNLTSGKAVTELEVFELQLHQETLDEAVLKTIDRYIPYHILFILSCGDRVQAWIGYKETGTGSAVFKVNQYYHTEWMPAGQLSLRSEGLSVDAVYESYVRQIAGDALTAGSGETLKASVERSQKQAALEKRIRVLQGKIQKEKQLNRQVELNGELKLLLRELDQIQSG